MSKALMKRIDPKIGPRLKELRESRGFSLNKLIEKLNEHVSIYLEGKSGETRISKIERSENNLTPELAIAYSRVFHVSLEYLFCESDDMWPENRNVKEMLGLSDYAIVAISGINQSQENEGHRRSIEILNLLFESGIMMQLVECLETFAKRSLFFDKCIRIDVEGDLIDTDDDYDIIARWWLNKSLSNLADKTVQLLIEKGFGKEI